jgi:hypothetical protein
MTTKAPKPGKPAKGKKPAANRPRGRPLTYTAEVGKAICARLAQGDSLAEICRDEGMPPAPTVRAWILDDVGGFAALSMRAYSLGYEALAEECLDIADSGRNDWMEIHGQDDVGWRLNGEHIQRSRLRIETRMRLLGKWAAKRYGDKVAVTDPDGNPLTLLLQQVSAAALPIVHDADQESIA